MKFKAKRLDNGKWVEGYLVNCEYDNHTQSNIFRSSIDYWSADDVEVDTKTLCQQVRGTELFEGDEVEVECKKYFIVWNNRYLDWELQATGKSLSYYIIRECEIKPTGRNIHDLKSEEK